MKTRILCAGLALALAALPEVTAVPIVQTATNQLTAFPDPQGSPSATLTTSWIVNEFNPAWGSLDSVRLDISFTVFGTIFETNPFSFPLNWTPGLSFSETSFAVFDGTAIGTQSVSTGVTSTPRLLEPNTSSTFTGIVTGSSSITLTSPADLALVLGTGTGHVDFMGRLIGLTGFGALTGAGGNATMTLTYNAPDMGSPLILLALALPVLAWFGRRRHAA